MELSLHKKYDYVLNDKRISNNVRFLSGSLQLTTPSRNHRGSLTLFNISNLAYNDILTAVDALCLPYGSKHHSRAISAVAEAIGRLQMNSCVNVSVEDLGDVLIDISIAQERPVLWFQPRYFVELVVATHDWVKEIKTAPKSRILAPTTGGMSMLLG